MSDLIKREDAKKAILGVTTYDNVDAVAIHCDASVAYSEGWLGGIRDALRAIEDVPSAEPEQKKGEWSNYKDEHCCSVCKCVVISDCWDDEIRYDYCPYCGADMRGE